jgi:hypothetical protein
VPEDCHERGAPLIAGRRDASEDSVQGVVSGDGNGPRVRLDTVRHATYSSSLRQQQRLSARRTARDRHRAGRRSVPGSEKSSTRRPVRETPWKARLMADGSCAALSSASPSRCTLPRGHRPGARYTAGPPQPSRRSYIPEEAGRVKWSMCPFLWRFPAAFGHAGRRAGVKVERPVDMAGSAHSSAHPAARATRRRAHSGRAAGSSPG